MQLTIHKAKDVYARRRGVPLTQVCPDAVRRSTCEQTLLSGVKMDYDGALAHGVENFRATKRAHRTRAMANYG